MGYVRCHEGYHRRKPVEVVAMVYVLYFLLYGFLLTATIGLLASWVDRKVTARVQYRVGPPVLQPFIDIVKLLGKETLVPKGASKITFLGAPLIGLAGVMLASTILVTNNVHFGSGPIGDVIVVIYLLTLPSISIILGGFASRNPLASLGASREMKLVLSYELPFVLAIFVPVIQACNQIEFSQLLLSQSGFTVFKGSWFIASWSGAIAFLVAVLCVQAKLALVPFDMPEAETEIVGGPLVEYSGSALAMYKLMKNMLLFVLPFFLMIMFLGGIDFTSPLTIFYGVLKYISIVAIITVIRNTNPRIRIDQAVRFFWGPVTVLAIVAVILAFKGF